MRTFLVSATPFLLGALVLLRWLDGTLIYYVADRYTLLVAGGAVFLVLLGLLSPLYRHALSHVKVLVRPWQIIFLLLPILFGFIISPSPLSAQTAMQRGVGQQLPAYLTPEPFSFAVDSSKRSFGDWANILFSRGDKSRFAGQDANISGFITIDGDNMYLTRFQVSCCAADGRPMGILLEADQDLKSNTWWQVSGQMQMNDAGEIYLDATEMTPIEIPSNPYV